MIKAIYRFTRDSQSVPGFISQNTPSTDALNVVLRWKDKHTARSYQTIHDGDELLEALLSWTDDDSTVGTDLDSLCTELGIVRVFVNKA